MNTVFGVVAHRPDRNIRGPLIIHQMIVLFEEGEYAALIQPFTKERECRR